MQVKKPSLNTNLGPMLLYRDDLYKIHSIFKRLAEKHKKVDEPIASPIIETETFVFDDWDDFINHSH